MLKKIARGAGVVAVVAVFLVVMALAVADGRPLCMAVPWLVQC
jgi:hypothetical protein